jgi:hypothetical protein
LGVIIVEDNVSDPSYNQSNYYANNQNGAMGGYESLPNPVPGSQMIFDHVGRALLGGYDGQTGSVPATVTDNSTANHIFSYTVPNNISTEELKIISVIIDESNGQIINASETKLYPVATEEIVKANHHFNVYPTVLKDNSFNASFNVSNKEVSLEVFTMWGVKVYSQNIGKVNGNQNILVNLLELSNGQYLVNLNTPGQTDIRRIIIAK